MTENKSIRKNRENIKIKVKGFNKIKMNKVHIEEKTKDKWEGAKEKWGDNKDKREDNRDKDLQKEDKITEGKEVSDKKTIWKTIETTDNKNDLIIVKKVETSGMKTIMKTKGINPEEMIETGNNPQEIKIKYIINKITGKEITVNKINPTQE